MNALAQVPAWAWTSFGMVLGLVVGSFANVCISRLPEKKSVSFPASHCPKCKTPIRATDNVPILSYLILQGKCRACSEPISIQYPVVELITGLLMAGVFYKFGMTWATLIFAIVIPALVIITVIDLEHQIIPDIITLPGIGFGLVAGSYLVGWQDSLIGLLVGGGLFLGLAEGYFKLRGREGMGGGDIKYIAAAGALLGWKQVLLVIFLGSVLGGVVGAIGMSAKKLDYLSLIPFGPFLAAATLVSIFSGNELIGLYLDMVLVKQ